MSLTSPKIAIVMGSKSDWVTMQEATQILDQLHVPYHVEIVSAHRTPDKLFQFAENAQQNGYEVIIAGAGGAAHLPGMIAAKTIVPVLGGAGSRLRGAGCHHAQQQGHVGATSSASSPGSSPNPSIPPHNRRWR